jgi:hypothetical protein
MKVSSLLIHGDVVVPCPKTGREVKLIRDCYPCEFYKHWGVEGKKIVLTCSFGDEARLEESEETEKKEEFEDEE